MPALNPHHDLNALHARLKQAHGLIVACYCAAWCDTCTEYQPSFNALAARWPQHTFVWIDIEENAGLLDEEDVENFPTILIQGERGNLFYGALLPHIEHLERLMRHLNDDTPVIDSGPAALSTLLAPATQ